MIINFTDFMFVEQPLFHIPTKIHVIRGEIKCYLKLLKICIGLHSKKHFRGIFEKISGYAKINV